MVSVTNILSKLLENEIKSVLETKKSTDKIRIIAESDRIILEIDIERIANEHMCSDQTIIKAIKMSIERIQENMKIKEIKDFKHRNNYYVILKM